MTRDGRRAGAARQTVSAAGPVQVTLDALERDRTDAARMVGLDPSKAMLMPLVISLARLAAQEDARKAVR